MSAALGSLVVSLEANMAAFGEDMRRASDVAEQSMTRIEAAATQAESSVKMVGEAFIALAASNMAIDAVRTISSALTEAQKDAQKLAASLNFSTNGNAGAELEYLRETVRKLGLDFATASTAYAQFTAAAKGSGITADTLRSTFEGVSKATSQLGLSADETQGILLALSQMVSKGTVQAEELRGQLGERLPGAFQVAARAMGMTTGELGKLLQAGGLATKDFLPKFADELNKTYQSVDTLTSATNRLASAWEDWKRTISNGADGGGMTPLTRGLNESAAAMRELGNQAGIVQRILMAIGGFNAGALNMGKFDTTQVRANLLNDFAGAQDGQSRMLGVKDRQGGYLDPMQTQTLDDYTRKLKDTRLALDDLAIAEGKRNLKVPDLAADFAAQKAKQQEMLDAYLSNSKLETTAEKTSDSIKAENKAFALVTADFDHTSQDYAKALAAHNARIAELNKQPKGPTEVDYYAQVNKSIREKIAAQEAELSTTAKITDATKEHAKFLQDISDGYVKLTPDQIAKLAVQWDVFIKNAQALQERARGLAYDAAHLSITDIGASYGRDNANRQDSMTIMPAALREQEAALRAVDEKGREVTKTLTHLYSGGKIDTDQYNKLMGELNDTLDTQKKSVSDLYDQQQRLNGSWEYGADKALQAYLDDVTNVAAKTEQAMTRAFKGMEDALVTFSTTGKLDFKSLADSILADIVRIQIQQSITGPLATSVKAAGGFGKLIGSMFGGASTPDAALAVPSLDVGTDYLPADMLVYAHKGEAIVPAAQNGKSSSPQTIQVNVVNQTSQPSKAISASPRFDANGMVVDIILRDLKTNGPIRQALG
jgi:lambda family phage tail tape measure protein